MKGNNQNPRQITGTRRKILKQATLAGGIITTGIVGNVSACEEEKGDYEERDYTASYQNSDSYTEDKCNSGGTNSGTSFDMSSTCVYWYSEEGAANQYEHVLSNHSYAEHYSQENFPDDCEWVHNPGLESHRWSARSNLSDDQIDYEPGSNVGTYPEMSSGNDHAFSNTAYTGLDIAIGTITGPAMDAYALTNALAEDLAPEDSYFWDERQNWNDYLGSKSCMAHFVYWGTYGNESTADVVSEDYFSNGYGSAWVEHDIEINYPNWKSDSVSYSKTDTQALSEGDTVESDDGKRWEVTLTHEETTGSDETKRIKMSEEVYKRNHPEKYRENGAPDYVYRYPYQSTSTFVAAKRL